ncbi:MAG: Asp-tRNA(Asn)/Glu-tRNA(Gln) amidotransferase subunit GatA [Firmicutes bacterium]|nr:Asp-tRNA(Asn)/Glu-tRNA(Gln) amidotransferase subunit GatA [Bacillota bacterium]
MNYYYKMSVAEAARALQNKEITSKELTESVLERIEEVEEDIRGFVTLLDGDEVLLEAEKIDQARVSEEPLPHLAGIPMALKDNLCTRGVPTTCASKMLQSYCPPYDACVVEKLKESRTILMGKANMDEFAMGSSTENSAFFTTRNPWDTTRVPGGSSGGSAALVAAGEVFFALGSDTGGSVRQPASFCGVVGLKPTYGLVSRFGLIAFASSLDQIGPLTRDVRDCAMVMEIIAGHDPRDSTSAPKEKEKYTEYLGRDIKGFKVALPRDCFTEGLDAEVKKVVMGAVGKCTALGIEVEDVSMPHMQYAFPAYYIVSTSEAFSNLARYDGVQYGYRADGAGNFVSLYKKTRSGGFGQEVKKRIMLGTYFLSSGYYDAYYLQSLKARTQIREELQKVFRDYDFIVTPTSPTVAFQVGEKGDDPLTMSLSDIYTIIANLAGVPAISIPCGFVGGMPVGLQVMGRPFEEGRIFQFCYALECLLGVRNQLPETGVKRGGTVV